MKYLVPALLIAMSSFFGFSAQAEDGKQRYFIADQIFNLDDDHPGFGWNYHGRDDIKRANRQGSLWYKISVDLGSSVIPHPERSNYRLADCLYDLPFKTLQDIRKQFGTSDTYQKIWVENQNRVFSACDIRTSTGEGGAPIEPKGEGLPARAKSDFLYQLASWNFYSHDTDAAQTLYEQVAADRSAPMRPYANYMLLRVLNNPNDKTKSYAKTGEILADPTLKDVFSLVENYRFILGWDDSGPDPKAHLNWLLSVIKTSPEKADDIDVATTNYSDALEQLNAYFPTNEGDVDWWLKDKQQDSARMEAVRAISPQSEIADWMQAQWASNWFDNSWLWALHRPNDAYWPQNKNIVNHAWTRWKSGGGMEWLEIAARRVHPKDPLAPEILAAMSVYLAPDMKPKFGQHKAWLFDLWVQSIRIHLGRDEFSDALALVKDDPGFTGYAGIIRPKGVDRNSPLRVTHEGTLSNAIRWLYYTGHYNEARSMLAEAAILYPASFQYWKTLLATDWDSIVSTNIKPQSYGNWEVPHVSELWQAIVNSISTDEMKNLAQKESYDIRNRAYLSRTALTRAFLLNESHVTLRDYALITANLNPTLRDPLLASFATSDRNAFISFMVKNPRFRPLPHLYLVDSFAKENQLVFSKIDSENPMDNNWWCAVSGNALDETVFEAARVVPNYEYGRENKIDDPEFKPYLDKQREFLSHHPYRTKVDDEETRRLEAIGPGPKYLSDAVIAHADSWRLMFFQTEAEREQNASDLASAVRSTHYGCGRYGGGQSYSRKAYKLLHDRYPDSIWADATPYWY